MHISRDNRVHVSTIGENGMIVATEQEDVRMGTPVDTSKRTFVRRTYPAKYNHGVRNMNTLIAQTMAKKKRTMRGGHFFLYRYIVLLAFLLCFGFSIASIYAKVCSAVPFILSTIYICLSIYNIVIYRLNRPLIHPNLAIYLPPGQMPRRDLQNVFYDVPLYTTTQTNAVGALIDPSKIVGTVQLRDTRVNNIKVMVYSNQYLLNRKFPKECVCYLILFILMFIMAAGCVSIFVV